ARQISSIARIQDRGTLELGGHGVASTNYCRNRHLRGQPKENMRQPILLVFVTAIGLSALVTTVRGQQPFPSPAADAPLRSAAELDQLLAPIALYPDPLIAQILPAATRASEIVLADRYVREGRDLNQID